MDTTNNNKENNDNSKGLVKPRCINIDCAFNSSLNPGDRRNFCNHPNVFVAQEALEITIAICSEFRSKKDYKFEKPNTLIDLKDNTVSELGSGEEEKGKAVTLESINEANLKSEEVAEIPLTGAAASVVAEPIVESEKPVIIETGEESYLMPKLTTSPEWHLQILKRLYQPFLKRGMIYSVIAHLIVIGIIYLFFTSGDTTDELPSDKRIVVIEDIETPKFNPPDMDVKEEAPANQNGDVTENKSVVKPQITRRNVTPRINRPQITNPADTTKPGLTSGDTTRRTGLNDSLLAKWLSDTNRYSIPDSLRQSFAENEVGLTMIYPAGWKVWDSRFFNDKEKEFSGVIITDTLSEEPGAVQMTILIDNEQRYFSKVKFKNTMTMLDTLSQALSADPERDEFKKEVSLKYYIFAPTNKIFVNANIKDKYVEKYKPIVEAIVRSIRIVKNNTAGQP